MTIAIGKSEEKRGLFDVMDDWLRRDRLVPRMGVTSRKSGRLARPRMPKPEPSPPVGNKRFHVNKCGGPWMYTIGSESTPAIESCWEGALPKKISNYMHIVCKLFWGSR